MGPRAMRPAIIADLIHVRKPYRGRVYDPCCAGGMFVQSEKFIENHADQRHVVVYRDKNGLPPRVLQKTLIFFAGFAVEGRPFRSDPAFGAVMLLERRTAGLTAAVASPIPARSFLSPSL